MVQNVYTSKGAPLIKFQCSEKIRKLKEGHLYAKTLSYYRNLEQGEDDTVKDEFDGLLFTPEGYLVIPEKGEIRDVSTTLFRTIASADCVFCAFDVDLKSDYFEFSKQQKEKMRSFGDTALVILDRGEFICRVEKAAEKEGIKGYFGRVQYFNSEETQMKMWCSLMKNSHNIAFWKRLKYSYQQEWRFVFDTHIEQPDHLDLDIGDISDISIEYPADTILQSIAKLKCYH